MIQNERQWQQAQNQVIALETALKMLQDTKDIYEENTQRNICKIIELGINTISYEITKYIASGKWHNQNKGEESKMPGTRAKFICDEIVRQHRFDGAQIKLVPVTGGSEENKNFWQYTPDGSINLTVTNPIAIETFELGKEYYVDFTPAS